jgi:bifunctional DNA-binding transcriptional regulator/antitoxin component of YhaV-PrlF toxin-antitoxin module
LDGKGRIVIPREVKKKLGVKIRDSLTLGMSKGESPLSRVRSLL